MSTLTEQFNALWDIAPREEKRAWIKEGSASETSLTKRHIDSLKVIKFALQEGRLSEEMIDDLIIEAKNGL